MISFLCEKLKFRYPEEILELASKALFALIKHTLKSIMKRFSYAIAATALGILALVGCSNAQQPGTLAPSNTKTTAPSPSTTSDASQGGFGALTTVVSNTRAAVEAGNFDQARQEFNKFEDTWLKVEDGVKAKAADSYSTIEDTMTQVQAALKGSDKAKALEGLQVLDKNIATVSKL